MQSSPWLASITVLAVLCGLRVCEGMSTPRPSTSPAPTSPPPTSPPTSSTSTNVPTQRTTVATTTRTMPSSSQVPSSTMTTSSARETSTGPMESTVPGEITTEAASSSIPSQTTNNPSIATLAPQQPSTPDSNTSVSTTEGIEITSTNTATTATTASTATTTTATTEATTIRQSPLKEPCDSDAECRTGLSRCLKGVCRCSRNYYPSSHGGGLLRCLAVAELSPHDFSVEVVNSNSIKLKWTHSSDWSFIAESACYEAQIWEVASSDLVATACVTSQSHEFLNLEYGTRYRLGLRVRVTEGGQIKQTIQETRAARTHGNMGVLAGLIILSILIVAAIIFIICLFKGRLMACLRSLKCTESLLSRSGARAESVQLQRVCTLPSSRPLQLDCLKKSVQNVHKDSDRIFLCIFDELRKSSPSPACTAAKLEANASKNRYGDVVPFDNCRVKLPVSSDDESDYINASYIPGFHGEKQFIAAQGPLESTVVDFWRMVWSERSPIIVMLTQLTEKGTVKCHPYWPVEQESSMQAGEITIENISTSDLGGFSLSIFRLKKGEEKRTVKHFNCPDWPDHSSILPQNLVDLVEKVQDYSTPDMAPVIIHCSAGVGRSGTYIAVDYVMNYIRDNSLKDNIDIYSFVLRMRRHRPLMVQTEKQYALIHDCAVLLVERKRQEEENQSEAVDSRASLQDVASLDDAAIPQSDTVRLIDEQDGAFQSGAKKAGEMANGGVQKRSSYTNQALTVDEAAAAAPAADDGGPPAPDQPLAQEGKESQGDRKSASGSLQEGDKSVTAEDAASFHTVDLHSQGGSKDDVTEGSKDDVTEGSKDDITKGSKDDVTEGSKDDVTEGSKDDVTEGSKDTLPDSGVEGQAPPDNKAGGEA